MSDPTTNPDPDDTEGHQHRAAATEDPGTPDANDTEGHALKHVDNETEDDDTEGHHFRGGIIEDENDDTEGHGRRL